MAVEAGALVGDGVGVAVGALVGDGVGVAVGALVGDGLGVGGGAMVGDGVGVGDGTTVGDGVGVADGATVGDGVGVAVGAPVGDSATARGVGSAGRPQPAIHAAATRSSIVTVALLNVESQPVTPSNRRPDATQVPLYIRRNHASGFHQASPQVCRAARSCPSYRTSSSLWMWMLPGQPPWSPGGFGSGYQGSWRKVTLFRVEGTNVPPDTWMPSGA